MGVGIHTGAESHVTLFPADTPGQGVVFRVGGKQNGSPRQEIPARAANVVETARCTVLGDGKSASVSTVEHLLSALAGLGVTDCIAAVDGPELPIGDGSAAIWTDAIQSVGIVKLADAPAVSPLPAPVIVTGRGGAFIAAYPSDSLRLTVAAVFEQHPLVGTQVARFEAASGADGYIRDVAPARTFGFIEEVEALRAAGLAQGGSLENAVVIYPDRYSAPLRFENELARHKLLDLIGDLSLAGPLPLLPPMDIVAVKPSHRLNTEFAARIREQVTGDRG